MVRHRLGIKLPRGWGFLRSPKKFAYNKVYHRITWDPIALARKSLKSSPPKKRSRGPGFVESIIILALVPFRLAFVLTQFLLSVASSALASRTQTTSQLNGPIWHVHLAGRKYRPDVTITENEQLVLRLDKGNKHDKNAVKVLKHDGSQVGFIARDDNRELAGWLRDGNSAFAFVTKADSSWPLLKVYVA